MTAPPPISHVVTADGVRIAWASIGTGPVLALLPPIPFSDFSAEWRIPLMRDVFTRLATSLRLVQFDGRGTGHSQRDVADLSFEATLRDIDAVLDVVSPTSPVYLLGFYHSCLTGLAWAARHPGRVERMALFGGALRGRDPMSAVRTQALLSLLSSDWDLFVDAAAVAWMGWGDTEQVRLGAEWFRAATTPTVARSTLEVFNEVDLADDLSNVDAATLVLHRRDGRTIPLEASEALTAALPQGRLRILDGETATLFFEDTDSVVDALLGFFTASSDPSQPSGPRTAVRRRGVIPRRDGLTPREVSVLRLIAAGESNGEIAHQLGVSVHTVERHAVNVYAKIGARGRADATAYAVRNKMT